MVSHRPAARLSKLQSPQLSGLLTWRMPEVIMGVYVIIAIGMCFCFSSGHSLSRATKKEKVIGRGRITNRAGRDQFRTSKRKRGATRCGSRLWRVDCEKVDAIRLQSFAICGIILWYAALPSQLSLLTVRLHRVDKCQVNNFFFSPNRTPIISFCLRSKGIRAHWHSCGCGCCTKDRDTRMMDEDINQ